VALALALRFHRRQALANNIAFISI
jgi:hypothetical protein